MPSIDKIKGRYLFGGSEAASIVPQAGSGNLVPTTGAGGITYYSNYVDCKTGSYFKTPFTTVARDRMIMVVGAMPVFEMVFDDDSVSRWPPTVARAKAMSQHGDVNWTTDGGITGWMGSGPTNLATFQPGNADGTASPVSNSYDKDHAVIAYRDGTFTFMPQIWIGIHPPSGPIQFGMMCGRNMGWFTGNVNPYVSAPLGGAPKSMIGSVTSAGAAGSQATSHAILLGYAEYSVGAITAAQAKAAALVSATEMVTLLEARGWTGLFHNPVTSE